MYLRGRGPKGRFVCRLCQAKIPAETLEQVFRDSFRAADGPYRDEAYRIFENWPSFDDATKRQLVDRLVASVRIGVDEVLVNLAINPGFFIETGPEKGNTLPSEHGFKSGGTRP